VEYVDDAHCSFVETVQDIQQASNASAHRTFVTSMVPTVLKLVDLNSNVEKLLGKDVRVFSLRRW